jgi:hypothetical protein
MRGAWLVVAIAACRIPVEHYVGTSDGYVGPGSDAAMSGPAPKHVYVVDRQGAQLFSLPLDASGAVPDSATQTLIMGSPVQALPSGDGSDLFVLVKNTVTNSMIETFPIGSDGLGPGEAAKLGTCDPMRFALAPDGASLAVACGSAGIVKIGLDSTNHVTAATPVAGGNVTDLAFTRAGGATCLFAADMTIGVAAYAYGSALMNTGSGARFTGSAELAFDPDQNRLAVITTAASSYLSTYQVDGCALGMRGTNMVGVVERPVWASPFLVVATTAGIVSYADDGMGGYAQASGDLQDTGGAADIAVDSNRLYVADKGCGGLCLETIGGNGELATDVASGGSGSVSLPNAQSASSIVLGP